MYPLLRAYVRSSKVLRTIYDREMSALTDQLHPSDAIKVVVAAGLTLRAWEERRDLLLLEQKNKLTTREEALLRNVRNKETKASFVAYMTHFSTLALIHDLRSNVHVWMWAFGSRIESVLQTKTTFMMTDLPLRNKIAQRCNENLGLTSIKK